MTSDKMNCFKKVSDIHKIQKDNNNNNTGINKKCL